MTILYILLALIIAITALFAIDRDGFWERLAGDPDLGQTNFQTLRPANKPNEALACPSKSLTDFCPNRLPDTETGVYALEAKELGERVLDFMATLKLVSRVDDATDWTKFRFVRRTPIMRYPDTFSIEVIKLGQNRSTLAIHGRAQLGQSDMKNNLELTRQILAGLKDFEDGS